MTKSEVISLLSDKHRQFLSVFPSLTEREFTTSVNGKWSPSQQLDHIVRSIHPVVLTIRLPRLLSLFFGKANRPSRTYDALIEKYHTRLAAGGKASGFFIPKAVKFQQRENTILKRNDLVQKLNGAVANLTEDQLDKYILPHPLLGKLTFREMLYFTAYHAEHHEKATKQNLA